MRTIQRWPALPSTVLTSKAFVQDVYVPYIKSVMPAALFGKQARAEGRTG